MGTLTRVSSLRSRAFIECPGAQIAAQPRAMAAATEALTAPPAPAPLTVVVEPEPGGTLPLNDHRGPGRFCLGMFPGQREQAGQARAFLAAFLGGWSRVDDAVLLIGELSANAVVHTGSGAPGGLFTVRASLTGAWLRAEVEDQGSSWNGQARGRRMPARAVPAPAAVHPVRHPPGARRLGHLVRPRQRPDGPGR